MLLQRTIRERVKVEGIGLHTGELTHLVFCPAPPNTGIHFVRSDLPGRPSIAVHAKYVRATSLATTLGGDQFSVATVEHCLSTMAAYRIDNLIIELGGPEIPIGRGNAEIFLEAFLKAGVVEQEAARRYACMVRPVYVGDDSKHAYLFPYNGLKVTCTIDFPHPKIGRQKLELDIDENSFRREIARARTFGFLKDVEEMRKLGLARGGSLENAIVLDDSRILNPEGLIFPDEFVRHKILDALGDLVTLGMPLMGHLVLYKAGHDLMNKLVKTVLAAPDSYRMLELGAALSQAEGDLSSFFNRPS